MAAADLVFCPACDKPVDTYTPTGTKVLRSRRHPATAYAVGGDQCPGAFGPVITDTECRRDAERTQRWRARPNSAPTKSSHSSRSAP